MKLLSALMDEQARRARIRRRLRELEYKAARRDAYKSHSAGEYGPHDSATCEWCQPYVRQSYKAF